MKYFGCFIYFIYLFTICLFKNKTSVLSHYPRKFLKYETALLLYVTNVFLFTVHKTNNPKIKKITKSRHKTFRGVYVNVGPRLATAGVVWMC